MGLSISAFVAAWPVGWAEGFCRLWRDPVLFDMVGCIGEGMYRRRWSCLVHLLVGLDGVPGDRGRVVLTFLPVGAGMKLRV